MTPLPPAANCLLMEWVHSIESNNNVINRHYWKWSGSTPVAADLNSLANQAAGFWNDDFGTLASIKVNLTTINIRDLTSDLGARGAWSGGHIGTNAGNSLPVGVAALLNFQIDRTYRGGKPRLYLPYGTENSQADDRTWTDTFRLDVDQAWTSFRSSMQAVSGLGFTIVDHYNVGYIGGVEPPVTLPSGRVKQAAKVLTTPHIDQVVGHSTSSVIANQRRRYQRSG